MIFCACSSGQKAEDNLFTKLWRMQFEQASFASEEIESIFLDVRKCCKNQRPEMSSSLEDHVRGGTYSQTYVDKVRKRLKLSLYSEVKEKKDLKTIE